jgi:hypothetical protein
MTHESHRSSPLVRSSLVVAVALLAAGACAWLLRRPLGAHTSAADATRLAEPEATPVPTAAHGAERAPAPTADEPAQPGDEPAASADELRAALRRLAQVDVGDAPALEAALRPLLVPGANVYAVLELSKAGGLGGGAELTLEELGALRALAFAVLVFNPAPGATSTLAAEGHALDGHALVVAILRALPDLLEPVRTLLADLVETQTNEREQRILDASYAGELERLATDYPELAELFQRMLAGLLAANGREADVLAALYATDASSPTLVGAALARWLEQHAGTALAWAAEAYDRDEASAEVRHAITSAVAASAPVGEASRFLGARAQRTMLVEFLTLGERAGGRAALEEEYWRLRVLGDADERARTMLVSGMTSAPTDALLAIANEDPSLDVRSQAWITLTFADGFQPTAGVLDRLEECWNDRAHPQLGLKTSSLLSAAGNFANKAKTGDPALLARVKGLLLDVYRDRSQSERDRRKALEKLEPLVSDAEFRQLSESW